MNMLFEIVYIHAWVWAHTHTCSKNFNNVFRCERECNQFDSNDNTLLSLSFNNLHTHTHTNKSKSRNKNLLTIRFLFIDLFSFSSRFAWMLQSFSFYFCYRDSLFHKSHMCVCVCVAMRMRTVMFVSHVCFDFLLVFGHYRRLTLLFVWCNLCWEANQKLSNQLKSVGYHTILFCHVSESNLLWSNIFRVENKHRQKIRRKHKITRIQTTPNDKTAKLYT